MSILPDYFPYNLRWWQTLYLKLYLISSLNKFMRNDALERRYCRLVTYFADFIDGGNTLTCAKCRKPLDKLDIMLYAHDSKCPHCKRTAQILINTGDIHE